jgi:hypothetical protein
MLNRETLIKASVVLLSTVVSLAVAEVLLRVITTPEYFLDVRTDSYWKALKGTPVYQTPEERDIVPDSELGWRMKPLFESVGVHHNSRGFRAKREYMSKPGTPRVFVIGDSFTYGLGVADDSTYPAYLEQITGIEVVNAGVNAYGVDQALLMWEIEGQRLHPTHVILGYFVDDFFRNELSFRDAPKPHFMFDPTIQQFSLKTIADDYANSSEESSGAILESSLRVPQAIGWLVRRVRLKTGFIDEERLARTARTSEYILRRLQSSVTQSGARLMIVVIGHSYEEQHEYLWIEKSIMDACRSIGIECLNLAAARREVDPGILYGHNGHFSEEGHRYAAKKIAAEFRLEQKEAKP